MQNARFGSLDSHFLRMSRVKRLFWKLWFSLFGECLVWNARFESLNFRFLGMSRVKCSFWKFKISLFGNVSCETLVLENILKERGLKPRFQTTFWRKGVWNHGFGPHFGGSGLKPRFQMTFWRKGVWNLGFTTFWRKGVWNLGFGAHFRGKGSET